MDLTTLAFISVFLDNGLMPFSTYEEFLKDAQKPLQESDDIELPKPGTCLVTMKNIVLFDLLCFVIINISKFYI